MTRSIDFLKPHMVELLKQKIWAVAILLVVFCQEGYSQTTHWVRGAGSVTPDEAADIAVDAMGNTYTTGYFTGSASFGTLVLNSSGVTDVFISKTNPQGDYVWAIKAGGAGSDRSLAICADASGNSYVTGFYYGTANFGSQTITSTGVQDIFIAKYDSNGALVWVRSAGGSGSDIGNGIAVDASGNVAVTGEFAGSASFGGQTLASMNGSVDIFTTRLDANGNFLWARKGSAPGIDRGIDLGFDGAGNIYVTGQFSDTITFDNTHTNNLNNAIFVVKYSATGAEQWFRKIGAGSMNVVSGIAVDAASGSAYLTGDFTGNVIFFGTPNTSLNDPYVNRIFLAKYNSSGTLQWAEADGSDSELTSRNLTLDASGNPYVVGTFKCRLNAYADQYGQGTFNSVGYWDVFVSKFNPSGAWQWSRSFGGRQDDLGAGIAVNASGQAHVAGSFLQTLVFPVPDNFTEYTTQNVNYSSTYCDDTNYGHFRTLSSVGNTDIVIAKIFDPARQPYDYYRRSGGGCARPYIGVCIGGASCPDTVTYCGFSLLSAYTNVNAAGPGFTYLWNTGGTSSTTGAPTTGYYAVTQTSLDGCFTSVDSIYAVSNTLPPVPLITDGLGINVNATVTEEIILCAPDSVLLSGSGFGSNAHEWEGPDNLSSAAAEIWATANGLYGFRHTDENGCSRTNTVTVIIDSLLPPIGLKLVCYSDTDQNDSLAFCTGQMFQMHLYDTISNPNADIDLCIEEADLIWSATPETIEYLEEVGCGGNINNFTPTASGLYLIEVTAIRLNYCDTDTVHISMPIYVELYPIPDPGMISISISGVLNICPGDSTHLVASPAPNYMWNGAGGINGTTDSNIWVHLPGVYSVTTSVSDTNSYGCTASAVSQAVAVVTVQSQPVATMFPSSGLICPNDSVQLVCNGSGSFVWQGPSGPVGSDANTVYVNSPGHYYCIRTDVFGCELVSNSLNVEQYSTPFILASPQTVLCQGDSILLSLVSSPDGQVQWQPPFSGSQPDQYATDAGTYTCMVTSCGIDTEAQIVVTNSEAVATIAVAGPTTVCEGDSIILNANPGQTAYLWEPGNASDEQIAVFGSATYILTTFDAFGCSTGSTPVTLTFTPNNVVAPTVNDTAVCPDGHAILIADVAGVVSWFDAPEAIDPIATGPVFTTPDLSIPTIYHVMQKVGACLSERAPVAVTMDDCEGIGTSNVFTPDGDGINDIFYFPQKGGTCFDCRIYSRWGRLLYRWSDANAGWDATIQASGQRVEDGVYYYILDYCDYKELPTARTGFIHVLGGR
jgi:gliding motility-associated-like protein